MRAGGDGVGPVTPGDGANPPSAVEDNKPIIRRTGSIDLLDVYVSSPERRPTWTQRHLPSWLLRRGRPAPVAKPREEPSSEPTEALSGARIYVENLSDTSFRFSGDSIYDVAQMAALFLKDETTNQRDKTYPSIAWAVRLLRHASNKGKMYRIGTATRSYLFGYDRATERWSVTVKGPELPAPARIQRFKMMEERVLMESVAGGTRSDAARKLRELMEQVNDPDVTPGCFLTFPEWADRADWHAKAGGFACLLNVGLKLDRRGKIVAFIVEFFEGAHRDSDVDNPLPCLRGRAGDPGPPEVRPTHKVTLVGRPTRNLSTRWRAFSTYPARVDERMLFNEYEGFLRGMFMPRSEPRLEDDLLSHGTAVSSRRRGAAHYLGHGRSVRRGATARLSARRVFPRAALGRARAMRTAIR